MRTKIFGTDGIRSRVGIEPVTPEMVVKLGWAFGDVLTKTAKKRANVLIGKDTRVSGYLLESALEAGLSSAGVDCILVGPMPTPGIAYLTRTFRCSAGIVISASHNPFYDNGIKFFSPEGFKLDDEVEEKIESTMKKPLVTCDAKQIGKAVRYEDATGRYIEFCKRAFPQRQSLNGLKIVVDSANGAGYSVAPNVFTELGAKVISVADKPDGFNINDGCGSTSLDLLRRNVIDNNADLGVALDGDGDRVMLIDNQGNTINGDQMLYLIAMYQHETNELEGGVMGTVMTNLSLAHAFKNAGIEFARAQVGDRNVLAGMVSRGWMLGGETSGHIICLDKNTTGDGIIAALEVLNVMINKNKALHELVEPLTLYPQTLINVKTKDMSSNPMDTPKIKASLQQAEKSLADKGRIILRASGTEPLIRVMVEAQDEKLAQQVGHDLAQVVKDNTV